MAEANCHHRDTAVTALQAAIRHHVRYSLGKEWQHLSAPELFRAVAFAVRDQLMDRMLATEERYRQAQAKRLYYLSIEFLMGRSLSNNLSNLGLLTLCQEALRALGVDLSMVEESERDAALGNGGLGRLAACFLDSLATLGMPGYGYGIHYEYGLFQQEITNGYQQEKPDNWLASGTPWEIERLDEACLIPVYGRIEHALDRDGQYNPMWMDWNILIGVPHDLPIVGYGGQTVNYLRLYSARASSEFDMQIFNAGDYLKAVEQKIASETITKVLYPPDTGGAGQELRFVQEYFLVACAIRDIVKKYLRTHTTFEAFSSQVAIQLNDTHPAVAVAELMRVLIDENDLAWERAWEITQATLGYTNHTLLPEALERWPVALFEHVLPRHLQIINEINVRFLQQVAEVKFALNGALTIGTLDGANIEIMQEVGQENIFIFGLQAHEIHTLCAQGVYEPRAYYTRYPTLQRVLDALHSNCFCRQEPDLFRWMYHALLDHGDRYFHLADLPSYIAVQAQVGAEFTNPAQWTRKAILNVARVGIFSSDRTIRQYARDIWHIASIPEGRNAR